MEPESEVNTARSQLDYYAVVLYRNGDIKHMARNAI